MWAHSDRLNPEGQPQTDTRHGIHKLPTDLHKSQTDHTYRVPSNITRNRSIEYAGAPHPTPQVNKQEVCLTSRAACWAACCDCDKYGREFFLCVCARVCICVYGHAYGGPRLMLGIILCCSSPSYFKACLSFKPRAH